MQNTKIKFSNTLFLLLFILSCQQPEPSNSIPPPYAVSHVLDTLKVFADGKITTMNGISFSKDGQTLYLSGQRSKQFDNERKYAGLLVSHFEAGTWTEPKRLTFGLDIDAYHPVLSADNQTLFFNSRSHLDSGNVSIRHNIWKVSKTQEGWGYTGYGRGCQLP